VKLLDVKNISLSFKNGHKKNMVLKNVSFTLNKSQTIGIVGESGSGKSLTALSIINLLPVNANLESGEILYYENDKTINLLELSPNDILKWRGKHISMIFQEPMTSLNPSLTCGYQVAEVLMLHEKISQKNAGKKVMELFHEVKLPNPERIFRSYPHEISGGQKQRVMIAMAIALNPSVLIADEPTTALDVTVQRTILELLKELQRKYHMSIIFISHDLGVISQIADKILVMYKGEVVEHGDNRNVLHNPKHPYTKGLLNCRPELSEKNRRLPIISDFLDSEEKSKKSEPLGSMQKITEFEEEILKVKNLHKIYFDKPGFWGKSKESNTAVHEFSFSVYKGETLGLVGESGCGKTTLGRVITRLIEKTSGEIEFKGKSLNRLTKKELKDFRKSVQIIFQDPYSSLNPKLTVGEMLTEPLVVHHLVKSKEKRKAKVLHMLQKVRLSEDSYSKYPHQFSGGQRQRIVIARALMLEPEFIICDESVSALDVSVQAEILNLLNDLKDEFNLTYIFISHDLSVVKYMSDRIMVMKEGALVEINKADDLYESPASMYTKNLIDSIPTIN
jgi:peptide/nickel transport system ATP-binding protein